MGTFEVKKTVRTKGRRRGLNSELFLGVARGFVLDANENQRPVFSGVVGCASRDAHVLGRSLLHSCRCLIIIFRGCVPYVGSRVL